MKEKLQNRLRELLESVIRAEGAIKGNIQLYRPESKDLVIISHKGFGDDFLDYFRVVTAADSSACGRALGVSNVLGISSIILINDVEKDLGFEAHRNIASTSGFRSVKSVPVIANDQTCLGMISTHFAEPKWDWDTTRLKGIMPELSHTLAAYAAIHLS